MAEGINEGANIKILWEAAVEKSAGAIYCSSEKSLLLQFSSALGRQTREEFLSVCTALSQEFSLRAERLRRSWEKTGESVALTGVLIAAAVFFIFM